MTNGVAAAPIDASFVVVGASLAGVRAAEALRRHGATGSITLIGSEPHRPYDRPPLSKAYLVGNVGVDRLSLSRHENELADQEIELRTGVAAIGLHLRDRMLITSTGPVPFDRLVIATGTSVRRLPHAEGAPVFVLRTLEDSTALQARLTEGARIVVIGAGFIGSEVAAAAKAKGGNVTVVEALPIPLERQLGADMGRACSLLHERNGVTLLTGVGVASIEPHGVELADGTTLPAETVVVGVGVSPNTEWLSGSGLSLGDGVQCDAACRVIDDQGQSVPHVVACGDVARWPNELFDEQMRVEHWTNAVEMADHAARTLLGDAQPFRPVPYFWSDQYGTKIQFLGRATGFDEVLVVDGDPSSGAGVALYRRGDRLVGALGLNRIKAVMGYRSLLDNAASWAAALEKAGI